MEFISQVIIAVFTTLAILLAAGKNKWGFVFGLTAQPFWLYSTWNSKQWGMFFSAIIVTLSWAWGIYNWFYANKNT